MREVGSFGQYCFYGTYSGQNWSKELKFCMWQVFEINLSEANFGIFRNVLKCWFYQEDMLPQLRVLFFRAASLKLSDSRVYDENKPLNLKWNELVYSCKFTLQYQGVARLRLDHCPKFSESHPLWNSFPARNKVPTIKKSFPFSVIKNWRTETMQCRIL